MSTGAASVLAWSGAATAVIGGLSLLGTGLLARSEAATAADLAALAGADALVGFLILPEACFFLMTESHSMLKNAVRVALRPVDTI